MQDKLAKLNKLLEIMQDDVVKPSDMEKFLNMVLKVIKESKDHLETVSEEKLQAISQALSILDQKHSQVLAQLESKSSKVNESFISQLSQAKAFLEEVKKIKVIQGKDGVSPDPSKIALEASKLTQDAIKPLIPTIEAIENDIPKLGTQIRDGLELLQGDERLDKKAIKGLETVVEQGNLDRAIGILDQRSSYLVQKVSNLADQVNGISSQQSLEVNGHVIKDGGTALTQRSGLNIAGIGYSLSDNSGTNSTDLTLQTATVLQDGMLTAADWTTFNSKLSATLPQYHLFVGNASNLAVDAGTHLTFDTATNVLHVHKLAGDATDGLIIESSNGTDVGILGAANTANVTWYGSHNYDTATANTIAGFGASKTLQSLDTATYPSLTELAYLKGVTSAIQTQLDGKFTLAGISGGQIAIGGTGAGDDLTLRATSSATDGDIIFQTDPTTERMRLLSTGEFLIGGTATIVGEQLLVSKNQNALTGMTISNSTAGTASRAIVYVETSGSVGMSINALSASYTTSGMLVAGTTAIVCNQTAGMNLGTSSNTQLSFWTNNTERARFLSTGEFIVGGTALIGTEFTSFQRNANSNNILRISNTTSGTAGAVGVYLTPSGCSGGIWGLSTGYTPSGIYTADSIVFSADSNATQMNIGTIGASPLSFWTTNVKVLEIAADATTITYGSGGVGTLHKGLIIDAGSTGQPYIYFKQNSVVRGLLGNSSTASGLIAGSVLGDLCIRNPQRIMFSADGGNTSHGDISALGNWSLGTTTGTVARLNVFDADASGQTTVYVQNTLNTSATTMYFDNNRGSFASYGGFLQGGSANVASSLFGLSRADTFFMFSDGASSAGMAIGTLTADDLVFGTNNAARFTISSGGTMLMSENSSIGLDPALSADGTFTGTTITGTSGYSQAFGDVVYLDPTDSRWEACDANAAAGADGDSRGNVGMVVVAGTDGNACTILLQGVVRADANFPAFTINNQIYISETAGDVTQTQPTTADAVIRVLGFALTADSMYFNPSPDYTTHT